jgi:hypothetical protein
MMITYAFLRDRKHEMHGGDVAGAVFEGLFRAGADAKPACQAKHIKSSIYAALDLLKARAECAVCLTYTTNRRPGLQNRAG